MNRLTQHIATLLWLASALMLTNCTADDHTVNAGEEAEAITFGAKVEGQITRSSAVGIIDYSVLSTTGFGVYAYGMTDEDWYNKEVEFTGTTPAANPEDLYVYPNQWSYWGMDKPTYWKKDQTTSFYAYAPYGTNGCMTALAPSSGTADPTVAYTIADSPDNCVDLLWGVNGNTGKPWTNATLAQTNGPILFTFRHALAAIGFHVQAFIDKDNNLDDLNDESEVANMLGTSGKYKITVKQLTISGNFYPSATLNLNNTTANTPLWSNQGDNSSSKTLTVANSLINADFRHPSEDTPESIMGKPSLTGITQDAQQLIIVPNATTGKEQCFFVIPDATERNYTVTIDWVISGQAPDGTYISEERTSTVNVNNLSLSAGIKYYINFIISLRSLSLNVTATDWNDTPQELNVTIEHGTSANSSLTKERH